MRKNNKGFRNNLVPSLCKFSGLIYAIAIVSSCNNDKEYQNINEKQYHKRGKDRKKSNSNGGKLIINRTFPPKKTHKYKNDELTEEKENNNEKHLNINEKQYCSPKYDEDTIKIDKEKQSKSSDNVNTFEQNRNTNDEDLRNDCQELSCGNENNVDNTDDSAIFYHQSIKSNEVGEILEKMKFKCMGCWEKGKISCFAYGTHPGLYCFECAKKLKDEGHFTIEMMNSNIKSILSKTVNYLRTNEISIDEDKDIAYLREIIEKSILRVEKLFRIKEEEYEALKVERDELNANIKELRLAVDFDHNIIHDVIKYLREAQGKAKTTLLISCLDFSAHSVDIDDRLENELHVLEKRYDTKCLELHKLEKEIQELIQERYCLDYIKEYDWKNTCNNAESIAFFTLEHTHKFNIWHYIENISRKDNFDSRYGYGIDVQLNLPGDNNIILSNPSLKEKVENRFIGRRKELWEKIRKNLCIDESRMNWALPIRIFDDLEVRSFYEFRDRDGNIGTGPLFCSLSCDGILSYYRSSLKENEIIDCITFIDLVNGQQQSIIKVGGTSTCIIPDNSKNIYIVTNGKKIRNILRSNIFISKFKEPQEISYTDKISGWCDMNNVNHTREIFYANTNSELCSYNIDTDVFLRHPIKTSMCPYYYGFNNITPDPIFIKFSTKQNDPKTICSFKVDTNEIEELGTIDTRDVYSLVKVNKKNKQPMEDYTLDLNKKDKGNSDLLLDPSSIEKLTDTLIFGLSGVQFNGNWYKYSDMKNYFYDDRYQKYIKRPIAFKRGAALVNIYDNIYIMYDDGDNTWTIMEMTINDKQDK